MSRIRGKDTAIELQVRSALHRRGFRFRVNRRGMPGTPDIVLARWRAVVFVNGCFWHSHGCALSTKPSSNREFWSDKLAATVERDRRVRRELAEDGWRVLTVWECALRNRDPATAEHTIDSVEAWLREKWGGVSGGDEVPQ